MAKQAEVDALYKSRGYAQSGDAYNAAMRNARLQDEQAAAASQAPVHYNPEIEAQHDRCITKCAGCCGEIDEHNPENNNVCCIIL